MISGKRLVVILPILLVLSAPSMATLGGDETSIAADQVQMKATRSVVSAQNYTTHEMQIDSGILVREYVSAQGRVSP